jgi:hypothetical protein
MDIKAARIPRNSHNQEVIKSEQEMSDYSYSQDVPEELRMIHRFLRESYQLDLNVTLNYTGLKWMARHIFHYVGLERAMAQMAESATQKFFDWAERTTVLRIAIR